MLDMCGIAGAIQLDGKTPFPRFALRRMAASLHHRGPDEDGFFEAPGLAFASRRLSIVGLSDGRQPVTNEARDVTVVLNGELFEFREIRRSLEARGHVFRTQADTELIPHLWEDHQEGMFEHLRGQFALALWDRTQQRLVLGRDRFGICPLYWTRQRAASGEWLLFASEIKALLASGMVTARADPKGLEHAFTFFGMPGPTTCFEGVHLLPPGQFLTVQRVAGDRARVGTREYWDLDFPQEGQAVDGDAASLVDQLEERLLVAIDRRLRADVPVVSYLSGGVDSSLVVAMASRSRGEPIPTFTIQMDDPALDEKDEAAQTARHTSSAHHVVRVGAHEVLESYPRLIRAAEGPVIDTSCAALLRLAGEVHGHGYRVALTGEGADEWLAGYPWYKLLRGFELLDSVPGLRLGQRLRSALMGANDWPGGNAAWLDGVQSRLGGPNAWLGVYGMLYANRRRFFSRELNERLGDGWPLDAMGFDAARMGRWNSIDRSLYVGAKVHLAGVLLNHKGDRVAMANSVETRYPFLDEDVVSFLTRLHPRWKLRGFGEKHILRLLAERWLPREVAWRRKTMFRAPLGVFHATQPPAFVEQLLSPESLAKTGYFDAGAVAEWRRRVRTLHRLSPFRASIEMGLTGVIATQLWHHTFIDPSLADLGVPDQPRLLRAVGWAPNTWVS